MSTAYNFTLTRGDSQLFVGTLTPGAGRTFATPIAGITFTAKRAITNAAALFTKTATIVAESPTAISYSVTLDPADTSAEPSRDVSLVFDVELVEADGWTSTPVRGVLLVTPDVTT